MPAGVQLARPSAARSPYWSGAGTDEMISVGTEASGETAGTSTTTEDTLSGAADVDAALVACSIDSFATDASLTGG